jgi:hypothetical protein
VAKRVGPKKTPLEDTGLVERILAEGGGTPEGIAQAAHRAWKAGASLTNAAGRSYFGAVQAGYRGHQGEWLRLVAGKEDAKVTRDESTAPVPEPVGLDDLATWLEGGTQPANE